MHYNTPAAVIAACAALWFAIWGCTRSKEAFVAVMCFAIPAGLLGACTGGVLLMAQHAENYQRCALSTDMCRPVQYDMNPILSWVIPLAIVGFLAIMANSRGAQRFIDAVLENDKHVPPIAYGAALILRMQIVIVGFVALSAFCWLYPDSRAVGSMILFFAPIMLAFIGVPSLMSLLWPILRIEQLGKLQKFGGWLFIVASVPICFLVIIALPASRFFDTVQSRGYDPRYAALAILFGLLAVYSVSGEFLAGKLHADIEQLTALSIYWGGRRELDPTMVRSRLRRLKRSTHAIAIITAGIAIGFTPQALHLSDVFGMITGVGFVALISYVDAELASRHLE
ncbi:hypothetical protein [Mycobacteroides chelonae]|uniref:hypothetical protein n=1 Tax=Mycobacteroides chelonae TaxID=1774 RepID=UPI0004ABB84A|nr:hypothetical protein [Mycobacteroides chelonae]MBF9319426.1 hypothetical protein [Mycobacteroides chelonae]OHT70715.1 hypothetical protein BKG66_16500 [Mycobacteroides chelonae]OHT71644.1 hypothetical protein BKG67_17055 [Mycobacteroides chelonae]OHT86152.1 hypothetical protein BKG70_17205 [Mycobacteroides chelonae]